MVSVGNSKKEIIRKHLFRLVQMGMQGDKLPSEKELCNMFGVSRDTVRAAIKELIADGSVIARKGSGVFIEKMSTLEAGRYIVGIAAGSGRQAFTGYYHGLISAGAITEVCTAGHCYVNLENYLESAKWTEELTQMNSHGLLWVNPAVDDMNVIVESGMPCVALGAFVLNQCQPVACIPSDVNAVLVDNFHEGYMFAKHCLEQGYDKLIVVGINFNPDGHTPPFEKGIESALKENGLDYHENVKIISYNDVNEELVYKYIHDGFTGIYFSHHFLAKYSRVLKAAGFIHGRNCCVMARASEVNALYPDIAFDALDFPHHEIGKQGAKLLFDVIENPKMEPKQLYIKPQIIPYKQ